MFERKQEIILGIRGTIFIFLPVLAIIYLVYGQLFNVALNYYTIGTAFLLFTFLQWMIGKYKQNETNIKVENMKQLDYVIQEGKWEVMDRGQTWLRIRPRFDFPFNYVVRDEIMIRYTDQQVDVEGPSYYIGIISDHINGDTTVWDKKKTSFSKIVFYGFLAMLPILLDGGMYWEAKVLYHNAFATTRETVENQGEMTMGNLVENVRNNGFGVENEEWIFYTEQDEAIVKTDKQFNDKQYLTKAKDSYGFSNLNIAGDWLYYVDGSSIYRMRFDGTEKESIYGIGYTIDMQIKGNWIYFISEEDGHVYKMNLDGKHLERILDVDAVAISVYDDHLLVSYVEDQDEYNWITERVDLSTQKRSELFSKDEDFIIEWNGYYYYRGSNADLERSLIADPTKTEVVVNGWIGYFTIVDDQLYYSLDQDNYVSIYRSNLDGKETKKLGTRSNDLSGFVKVGDTILFGTYDKEKINTETGAITLLEE